MPDRVKYVLDESRIPTTWYNLLADLPAPPPPVLHPGTLQPVGLDEDFAKRDTRGDGVPSRAVGGRSTDRSRCSRQPA